MRRNRPRGIPKALGKHCGIGDGWRKELREILRDRRTIITLVLMPMLVYPIIGVTFQKFLASQLTNKPLVEYRLGFRTAQEGELFRRWLLRADMLAAKQAGRSFDPSAMPAGTEDDPRLEFLSPEDPAVSMDVEGALQTSEIDVGIIIDTPEKAPAEIQLLTDEQSVSSRNARRYLQDRLRLLNYSLLEKRLRHLDPEFHPLFTITARTAVSDERPAFSLSVLVPLILILMTVTGAVYPAIDLTAGERERGTLEALISAPVRREELLLAKYVAVLAVAVLTAIANLTAMTATAYATGLESLLFGRGGLSPGLIVKVFGVLVVFAGFFSSILLAVTSFARSFKEAQAYLIPVMLVSIAPGVLALMPGLTLTWSLALAPLANMVLLTSDLFDGRLAAGPAALALGSTLIYTVIGLIFAAQIFGTDAVLYGSTGNWSDAWRRPTAANGEPTPAQVWGCLAVVLPALILVDGLLRNGLAGSPNPLLASRILLTISLFVILPAAWSAWERMPLKAAFQLNRAGGTAFLAAALAGLSLWPFAYEALLFFVPLEQLERLLEQHADLEARVAAIPYPLRLLSLAVAPAVTEELFFRGYFLQGLQRGWGRWPAILVSGIVFGAFHVFSQGLGFERIVPTTLLGWCLGWVCVRTGSVWPGMLLHVLNNSLLLSVMEFSDRLKRWGLDADQQTHLPAAWLISAAVTVLIAWVLLLRTKPRKSMRFQ